jgi:hypothetical protein
MRNEEILAKVLGENVQVKTETFTDEPKAETTPAAPIESIAPEIKEEKKEVVVLTL